MPKRYVTKYTKSLTTHTEKLVTSHSREPGSHQVLTPKRCKSPSTPKSLTSRSHRSRKVRQVTHRWCTGGRGDGRVGVVGEHGGGGGGGGRGEAGGAEATLKTQRCPTPPRPVTCAPVLSPPRQYPFPRPRYFSFTPVSLLPPLYGYYSGLFGSSSWLLLSSPRQ